MIARSKQEGLLQKTLTQDVEGKHRSCGCVKQQIIIAGLPRKFWHTLAYPEKRRNQLTWQEREPKMKGYYPKPLRAGYDIS